MADFSFGEQRIIEQFLEMGQGYVLDFSDRTFRIFIGDVTGIDVDNEKYLANGSSKANRLRTFIKLEPDHIVAALFREMHELKRITCVERGKEFANALGGEFYKIIERLTQGNSVVALDAIQANNDDKDFKLLAKIIRESINKNEPEAALDRLHTFVFKFLRELCGSHKIEYAKEESLNAIFGKYVKHLIAKKLLESEMSEKILRYSIQVIQAFNDIRNNKSLAHDNPILNYDESILIFNNVSSIIKFIQRVEEKHENTTIEEAKPAWQNF